MKKRRNVIVILAGIITLVLLAGLYNGMKIQYYVLETEQITTPVRIVLITDLHSCKYGKEEQDLIQAVEEQNPDIIALSGDIFDDEKSDSNTEYFLKGVSENYPCYYVTGNHEYYAGSQAYDKKMKILEDYHVQILSGTMEIVIVHGQNINICGVDDPASGRIKKQYDINKQLRQVQELSENNNYTILLSHRPELFETYVTAGFDLVLAGHAHGGQWRIPFVLNGLYAPDQGLFPEFAGGLYQRESTTMIVSRGLARETTRVSRIYNRPELVVIDIT